MRKHVLAMKKKIDHWLGNTLLAIQVRKHNENKKRYGG